MQFGTWPTSSRFGACKMRRLNRAKYTRIIYCAAVTRNGWKTFLKHQGIIFTKINNVSNLTLAQFSSHLPYRRFQGMTYFGRFSTLIAISRALLHISACVCTFPCILVYDDQKNVNGSLIESAQFSLREFTIMADT